MSTAGGEDRDALATLGARATLAARESSPGATIGSLEVLSGGHSSLTYTAVLSTPDKNEQRIVFKVAPAGVDPVGHRDVLRQARAIRALAGDPSVCVPNICFESAGDPPGIPPFFAMEYVEGDSTEPLVDDPSVPDATLADRALAAARMLAALHTVDVEAIGLGDEPTTSVRAEAERWHRAFERVDEDLRLDGPAIGTRLLEHLPAPGPAVLVHGDYRLGNMRCVGPTITAVVDWEIWEIGDGRIDLAWLLMMLDPSYPQRRRDVSALPTRESIRAEHEAALGGAVGDLEWFHAYVRFKQAAATARITQGARRRGGTGFPDTIANLLDSARAQL